jgi:hypothetical protein
MSATLQRLHVLALELEQFVLQLGEGTTPATAALFIDRLHRCAGYGEEQRGTVGVHPLFERAWAAWLTTRDALGEQAGRGLDAESLLDRADALLAGSPEESAQDWAADLLLVGGVAPWVPGERGERLLEVLDECLGLAQAWPERFHPAALVALDRYEHEPVTGLPEPTRALLRGLRELPLLAAVDTSELRLEREAPVAVPSPAWTPVLHRAEEALQDAADHARDMAEFVARAADRGAIRAAAAGEDESQRLGWRFGMEFLLVLDGPDLHVAAGDPRAAQAALTASTIQGPLALGAAVETRGAWRWLLPDPDRWPAAGLRVDLRLGPDCTHFVIPTPRARP